MQEIGSYGQFPLELLECSVCYEEYKNPVVTQCGHTFCCDCYNSVATEAAKKKIAEKKVIPLTCPTCRAPLPEKTKPAVNQALVSLA